MTPLNTIIEEEKNVLGEKLYCALTEVIPKMQVVVSIGGGEEADICDLEEILPELLERTLQPLLTSAMQRAYEAGQREERADWLRSEIEKLEGGKLWEYDFQGKRSMAKKNWNDAITSIITRYKEELKVLTGE